MFLNLFGSDGPPGAHAGDYRSRFSIAMVSSRGLNEGWIFQEWRRPTLRSVGDRFALGGLMVALIGTFVFTRRKFSYNMQTG
jgi:hypothetical protein